MFVESRLTDSGKNLHEVVRKTDLDVRQSMNPPQEPHAQVSVSLVVNFPLVLPLAYVLTTRYAVAAELPDDIFILWKNNLHLVY